MYSGKIAVPPGGGGIRESQKQTFQKIGILLRQPVFTHGQLYVAASRVRSFNGLRFYISVYT
jgi:ATP-dependent DNA helicase PIF1